MAVRAVTQGVIVCVLIDALFIVLYLADMSENQNIPAIEMRGVSVAAMRDAVVHGRRRRELVGGGGGILGGRRARNIPAKAIC